MASHADDSSVDDNLSSVGDTAWDMIDEASVCSDSGTNSSSRQPTPLSEPAEHIEYGVSSFMSNITSSNTELEKKPSDSIEFDDSQQDDIFTPTASFAFRSSPQAQRGGTRYEIYQEMFRGKKPDYIKLLEDNPPRRMLRWPLKHFDEENDKEVYQASGIKSGSLIGYVKMMSHAEAINLDSAFELLFVGPKDVRSKLVEKIGTVLAARVGGSASKDAIESSRVTVVPISAFEADDASPEVLLIDSFGVDMKIEECIEASYNNPEDVHGPISLRLNNNKIVQATWDQATRKFHISPDFQLPHLAVIYIPERETASSRQTRTVSQRLLLNLNIPTILVSQNSEWTNVAPEWPLSAASASPHLSIESTVIHSAGTPLQMPLDLGTFLAIDACQLNRNIAYMLALASRPPRTTSLELLRSTLRLSQLQKHASFVKEDFWVWWEQPRNRRSQLFPYGFLLAFLLGLQIFSSLTSVSVSRSRTTVPLLEPVHKLKDIQTAKCVMDPSCTAGTINSKNPVKSLAPFENIEMIQSAISKLPEEPSSAEYSASIIGDSHIVISRDERTGRAFKRAQKLGFTIHRCEHRGDQQIKHEVSKLSDGIHILELPAEDAYGKLNISVSTKSGSRLDLQVDFGTPWLKIASWESSKKAMEKKFYREWYGFQKAIVETMENIHIPTPKITEIAWPKHSDGNRRVTTISRYAENLAEAISGVRVADLGRDIQEFRRNHFRGVEKKLLHAWWKARGIPGQEVHLDKGKVCKKFPSENGKACKKNSRH